MTRARPAGVSTTGIALAGIMLALIVIAATTGSGWTVVLIAGLAGVFVVGFVWPFATLRRISVSVSAPVDAMVERPFDLDVLVTSTDDSGTTRTPSRRTVLLRPRDLDAVWTSAFADDAGAVAVTPLRRGVIRKLTIDVRTAAPLGIFVWTRAFDRRLTAPIEVAPLPDTSAKLTRTTASTRAGDAAHHARGSDTYQRIRDYTPGDPRKHIHWPATARHSTLLTREFESQSTPRVTIVVDLRGDPAAAEVAASRAAGLTMQAIDRGLHPTLATAESASSEAVGGPHPVTGRVRNGLDVGRRLARAVPGPVAPDSAAGDAVCVWVRAEEVGV